MAKAKKIMTDFGDEPPILYTIDNERYHKSSGISRSELWTMHKHTPFRARFGKKTTTKPQALGNVAHCAILEPEDFDNRFVIGPDVNKNTNIWKGARDEAAAAGKELLDQKQFEAGMMIRDAVARKATMQKLLRGAKFEQAAYAIDPDYGVLVKCKPDLANSGMGVLADIKTAADAGYDAFGRSCAEYGYHLQEFHYSRIWNAVDKCNGYVFVVVESAEPFDVAFWECPPAMTKEAEAIYHQTMPTMVECLRTDTWPGFPDKVMPIDMKRWAYQYTAPDNGE
jgi:hypothetical protein